MEKTEYRAVIKYLLLKKKRNNQVKLEFTEIYEDSAPSSSTINSDVANHTIIVD